MGVAVKSRWSDRERRWSHGHTLLFLPLLGRVKEKEGVGGVEDEGVGTIGRRRWSCAVDDLVPCGFTEYAVYVPYRKWAEPLVREEGRGYHGRLLREEGRHSKGVDTGGEVTEQVGPPGGSSLHTLHLT